MVRKFSESVQVRVQASAWAGSSERVRGRVPERGRSDRSGEADRPDRSNRPDGFNGSDGAEGFDGAGSVEGGSAGPSPEAFIWRGRLYVVRSVLAQWRERRAWWRDALEADETQVRPGETLVAASSEQHVWRVEASPGWSFTPGVYDLAHDETPRGDQWSLVRVSD